MKEKEEFFTKSDVVEVTKGVIKTTILVILVSAFVVLGCVAAISLLVSMTGCETVETTAAMKEWTEKDIANEMYLYTDPETHVEYLVLYSSNGRGAITPRLCEDSSLYISSDVDFSTDGDNN